MTAGNEIFVIMTERYQHEDHSGRDVYEFMYDPEEDAGFFTTKEAAKEWIEARHAEAQDRFDKAMAAYTPKQRQYEIDKAEADKAWDAYARVMEKTGQKVSSVMHKPYISPPSKPALNLDSYRIVPIEKEA